MEIPDLAAAGNARGAQDPFTDQDHQDVMLVQDSINLATTATLATLAT